MFIPFRLHNLSDQTLPVYRRAANLQTAYRTQMEEWAENRKKAPHYEALKDKPFYKDYQERLAKGFQRYSRGLNAILFARQGVPALGKLLRENDINEMTGLIHSRLENRSLSHFPSSVSERGRLEHKLPNSSQRLKSPQKTHTEASPKQFTLADLQFETDYKKRLREQEKLRATRPMGGGQLGEASGELDLEDSSSQSPRGRNMERSFGRARQVKIPHSQRIRVINGRPFSSPAASQSANSENSYADSMLGIASDAVASSPRQLSVSSDGNRDDSLFIPFKEVPLSSSRVSHRNKSPGLYSTSTPRIKKKQHSRRGSTSPIKAPGQLGNKGSSPVSPKMEFFSSGNIVTDNRQFGLGDDTDNRYAQLDIPKDFEI